MLELFELLKAINKLGAIVISAAVIVGYAKGWETRRLVFWGWLAVWLWI